MYLYHRPNKYYFIVCCGEHTNCHISGINTPPIILRLSWTNSMCTSDHQHIWFSDSYKVVICRPLWKNISQNDGSEFSKIWNVTALLMTPSIEVRLVAMCTWLVEISSLVWWGLIPDNFLIKKFVCTGLQLLFYCRSKVVDAQSYSKTYLCGVVIVDLRTDTR